MLINPKKTINALKESQSYNGVNPFRLYFASIGGINRLAKICSRLMPVFIILYIFMCFYVIVHHIENLIPSIMLVIKSAFVGHAPLGGFVSSTFLLSAQLGAARAVYSGDIGIGFDAIINSESKSLKPEHQARLSIFAGATDSLICTLSILVVLLSQVWSLDPKVAYADCVKLALSNHIPYTKPN